MPEAVDLELCLHAAVVNAFEVMCFTEAQPSNNTAPFSDGLRGDVEFGGDATGRLRLELSIPAARSIASSFYGEDESDLSPEQVEAVVGEMTNVICGSMLSMYGIHGSFWLSTPEVCGGSAANELPVRHSFQLEGGPGFVSLALQ
jgi:CheY-specific phosphatase CheX